MNQFASRAILAGVLMLVFASYLAAQSEATALAKDPVTGLTAEKAVQLGAAKFSTFYEKKSQDSYSTVGMVNMWSTFTQLRRYVNDRAVAKRTKKQQALIATIRSYCNNIRSAYIDIEEASAGGGTMYHIFRAAGMIDVETTIGKVLLSMEQPKTNPRGRQQANKTITSLVANIRNLPKPASDDPTAIERWRDLYNTASKRLRVTLPKLHALLKSVPDNGSVALAQFAKEAAITAQVQ